MFFSFIMVRKGNKLYFKEGGRKQKKSPYNTLSLSDTWQCYREPERNSINSPIL